jgi:NitT/TauT family transport system permease protein
MRSALRKAFIVIVLLGLWEVAARVANTPLLFPTFLEVGKSFWSLTVGSGALPGFVKETCKSLFAGFGIGAALATVLTALAINTKLGEEFLATITGSLAPLPAVAVFPISLMIFGISLGSVVFISAFATVFPVAVAMTQGFRAVSQTLRGVGRNLGMSKLGLTCRVLMPAALPSILTGLRSGFSNAFRALVAVEMVIGAATGSGGLGWFVMSSKQNLDIPEVYAGILAIMLVGLAFEGLFRLIEAKTVR